MARNRRNHQPRVYNPRQKMARKFTIELAYALLRRRGPEAFPKGLRESRRLEWAFHQARNADRGHWEEYTRGCPDDHATRDMLDRMAYENVLMWARKWQPTS